MTLPVCVELRSTLENNLLIAKHRTVSYRLSERTVAQISRSAAASQQSYEAEMVDHLQRFLSTRIIRDGGGGKDFQEHVRADRKHVWVRVVLEVQRFTVVDNSDFSPTRLTAVETLLILPDTGALHAPHFKQ